MKVKMVSYYTGNKSQVFATFEYQKIQFDMYKNLEEHEPSWKFMKDSGFQILHKIVNLDMIKKNCLPHLQSLDNHLK